MSESERPMMTPMAVGADAETEAAPAAAAVPRERGTVAVTGAAGFVGSYTCRALARDGWTVRAVVRDADRAAHRLHGTTVQYVVGDLREDRTLHDAVRGASAVVHLAAIAIEREGNSYEAVNTAVTTRLLDAAGAAGVRRFVHMSQNGASSASPHRFLRSKGIAEEQVTTSDLDWSVLRPSVIFGRGDEFVTVLARLVRLSPVVYPLPGGGTARFQPVAVQDIAHAVSLILQRRDTARRTYPVGGPAALTLRQMIERVLEAMRTTRILIPVSTALLHPIIAAAQRVLPHPPVTTELLALLSLDNTVPDSALWTAFGLVPTPFAPDELGYLRTITARDAWHSLA